MNADPKVKGEQGPLESGPGFPWIGLIVAVSFLVMGLVDVYRCSAPCFPGLVTSTLGLIWGSYTITESVWDRHGKRLKILKTRLDELAEKQEEQQTTKQQPGAN